MRLVLWQKAVGRLLAVLLNSSFEKECRVSLLPSRLCSRACRDSTMHACELFPVLTSMDTNPRSSKPKML